MPSRGADGCRSDYDRYASASTPNFGEFGFDITCQETLRGINPPQRRVHVGERETAHEGVSLFA